MELEYVPRIDPDVERELVPLWRSSFDATPQEWAAYLDVLGRDAVRAARRGGRVVGGLALFDTAQWFGRRAVPATGLAAVAIAPEARGQGVGRAMLTRCLEEARERGLSLASLYASTQRLYRGLGFEVAGACFQYSQPLRLIGRGGGRELEVRSIDPAGYGVLEPLHRARAADEQGVLDRNDALWRRVVRDDRGDVRAYLFGAEAAPEGYLVVRREGDDGRRILVATDVVARTARAARCVWSLLAEHATTAEDVRWWGPPLDPLLSFLEERDWRVGEAGTWMLRILDLPGALAARGWPEGVEGELELDVHDPVLPANAGRWRLRVTGGTADVVPGGRGELRLDATALAPLYSGFSPARRLALAGRLAGPPSAIALAERLFAGPTPWMPDRF